MDDELKILYRDEHLVAIDKPSGLLVHKTYLARKETHFAMQMLRDQLGQYVYPVHRLDRPTSGVLLFALSSESARLMSEVFVGRQIRKGYLAITRGYLEGADILDYPLKEELDKVADKFADQDKEAQEAVTHWQGLATTEVDQPVGRYATSRYSLVAMAPQTGRKHQLRRHMAHLRHPIVGDTTHGDGAHNKFFRDHFDCRRLLLHAGQLQFPHPITSEAVDIHAPLDETFAGVCEALGWDVPTAPPLTLMG